ncbi:MAG: DUF4040 domain-containing protein [Gammaproteobacteria bacterium]|nr:DUF4040 domain-containing protein [Gammaproteobacteria bacterium]MBU2478747.1 DUF4040 domain-containing protein [Gammaproteobacteria bacterium]
MILISTVIVAIMLLAAVAALLFKNHVAAVAAVGILSLALSVLFVILKAPDVAMTEAAVGAGLSALVLALGLRRLGLWQIESSNSTQSSIQKSGEHTDA